MRAPKMNYETILEHIQEMGKVDVTGYLQEDIGSIQQWLQDKGYNTQFEPTDRDYIKII